MKPPKLPCRRAVAIVADGPSAAILRHVSLPQELYVIGVNYASIWLPRCDAYMTACPDHRQRFALNHQRQGVRYYAAVDYSYGAAISSGDRRGPRERNVTFFDATHGPGMETDPRKIAVGAEGFPRSSTYAALNLAMHLGAKRVGLFGVDCTDRPRVSGGRPTGTDKVAPLFLLYDGSANVRMAGNDGPVDCFKTLSHAGVIEWLLAVR